MQVVDKYGNTFGQGHLIITSKYGKSKLPIVTVAWGNITGILSNQTDLQNALNLKVPTARTITINGTTQDLSADRSWTISTGITINTTPITGGVSGRLLFDDAGVVGETNGISWDKLNGRLGIGGTPTTTLYVNGSTTINNRYLYHQGNSAIQYFMTSNAWSGTNSIFFGDDSSATIGSLSYNHQFDSFAIAVNGNNRMQIASTGNVLINTTTDTGYKLDVAGTAIIGDSFNYGTVFKVRTPGSGWNFDYQYLSLGTVLKLGLDRLELRVNNNTAYIGNNGDSSNASLTVMSGHDATSFAPIIFGSGRNASLTREVMRIDNQNKYVGIGTTSPTYKLHVAGNTYNTFVTSTPFLVDTSANNYRIANLIANNGYHDGGYANNTFDIFSVGANSSSSANASQFFRININGGNSSGAFGASGNNTTLAQLNGVTNSILYVTAQGQGGYIKAQTGPGLTISTSTNGANLSLRSDMESGFGGGGINYYASINGANHSHRWFSTLIEHMRLTSGGNLLVGTTTDAGYKFDVNGTARVQSGVYVDTGRLSFKTSANDYDNYIQNDGSYGMKYTVRSTNRAHQFLNTADGTKGISIVPFDSTSGIGTIATSGGAKGQLRDFVYINSGASGLSFFSDRYNGQIAYYFNTSGRNTNTTDSYLSLYNNGTNLLTILNSGNVLVGTTTDIASSKLTVESTTQGFLPPRMSNAQMLAIVTPAEGLVVYDTTNRKLCCYDGATWQNLF